MSKAAGGAPPSHARTGCGRTARQAEQEGAAPPLLRRASGECISPLRATAPALRFQQRKREHVTHL